MIGREIERMVMTMKSENNQKYSIPQNAVYVLKLIGRNDKRLLALMVTETLAGVFTPFLGIYLPKLVLDELRVNAAASHMALAIGSFALLMAACYFLQNYCFSGKYWRYNFLRLDSMWELYRKTLTCDFEQIESAEGQTRYQRAIDSISCGDQSGISEIIPAVIGLTVGALGFLLYSGILARLNPLIILLLIATSSVSYFMQRCLRSYERKHKDEIARIDRKIDYLNSESSDSAAGKDIRLYGMKQWFLSARDLFLTQRSGWDKRLENRRLLAVLAGAAAILIRDGLSYAYLICMAAQKQITIPDFVLYFGTVTGFAGWISQMIGMAGQMSSASLKICDLRGFLEITDRPDKVPAAPLPDMRKPLSIEFRNVCFRYPGSEIDTLHQFTLKIAAGEKIAVVGVNGAGKTTLVKLLCGFYRPDSGEILINGENIGNFRRDDLYRLFSAVFQDILILPFTVAENVAMRPDGQFDRQRVSQCLALAGLGDDIRNFPRGIDSTMLKVTQEDGLLLSGGQQQKLILARALYKDAPLLLLDEPTAALDPIAENELYQKYHDFTQNKTAVFISHRFASTRFCDRIALISEGAVKELGPHDELMKQNGEYAKMYEIQSRYYRDDISLPNRGELV